MIAHFARVESVLVVLIGLLIVFYGFLVFSLAQYYWSRRRERETKRPSGPSVP